MQYNKSGKWELDCLTCCNNGKICPCCIFSGNPELPNLYNKSFPIKNKKKQKTQVKKDLYIFRWE